MIFKIFTPKNSAKKLAFVTQNKAKLCKILLRVALRQATQLKQILTCVAMSRATRSDTKTTVRLYTPLKKD
jgi:hypothetical protein